MTDAIMPKKGMRFFHSRVLSARHMPDKIPQLYEVTKVAAGNTYYKAVYDYGGREALGGNSEYITTENFHKVVLKSPWGPLIHGLRIATGRK